MPWGLDDLVANYGYVIVDECHHISAKSFEDVLRMCPARFVTGLSATLTRRDGHHPIVFMQCGPVRYRAQDIKHAMQRPFDHKVVVHKCTDVEFKENEDETNISDIYSRLIHSSGRNRRITDDVIEAYQAGRSPLILTDRVYHLEILSEMLSGKVDRIVLLKGGLGKKKLKIIQGKLAEWKDLPHVVLATGRYLGEGYDNPRLDTLFLAPCLFRGKASYPNTPVACTVFTMIKAKYAFMTTSMKTTRCLSACLVAESKDTRRLDTSFHPLRTSCCKGPSALHGFQDYKDESQNNSVILSQFKSSP